MYETATMDQAKFKASQVLFRVCACNISSNKFKMKNEERQRSKNVYVFMMTSQNDELL